ncbi:hypothetical protein [Vibrio sp. WXL103]|uniref:hypothetical protein n=1 Tax=Vibrio sp. WXL103 TaxID=3450710 RepID=UPI003EC8BE50
MSELYTEPQEIIERKERVKTADTLFSWECTPPRNRAGDWVMFILVCIMSGGWGYFTRSHVVMMILTILTILSLAAFFSFTAFQPHHYKYELTHEGIRVTDEERVPEIVFTIIRGLAWFGVIACLIAVVVIGPMAFVGAGAAALGAFSFTGFKKKASHYELVFYHHCQFRYCEAEHEFRVVPMLTIEPNDHEGWHFSCYAHATKEDFYRVVEHMKPLLKTCEVKIVEYEEELIGDYS